MTEEYIIIINSVFVKPHSQTLYSWAFTLKPSVKGVNTGGKLLSGRPIIYNIINRINNKYNVLTNNDLLI